MNTIYVCYFGIIELKTNLGNKRKTQIREYF